MFLLIPEEFNGLQARLPDRFDPGTGHAARCVNAKDNDPLVALKVLVAVDVVVVVVVLRAEFDVVDVDEAVPVQYVGLVDRAAHLADPLALRMPPRQVADDRRALRARYLHLIAEFELYTRIAVQYFAQINAEYVLVESMMLVVDQQVIVRKLEAGRHLP